MSIEMHCHTVFSVDARGTPEELVDSAAQKGVTALAVTEHNHLGSLKRASARAGVHGIRYFPGVELDGVWKGSNYHFLAYGFDPDDDALQALVDRHSSLYTERFDLFREFFPEFGYRACRQTLVAKMPHYYPTHPAPVLNQWYARDRLVEAGIFPDGLTYQAVLDRIVDRIRSERGAAALGGFSDFETVRDVVQNAGGVLLLAHVSRYDPENARGQIRLIRELLEAGMDGFELFHPANLQDSGFNELAREAESLGCPISGGSDFHGVPAANRWEIGSCRAPDEVVDKLEVALARRQVDLVR